MSRMLTSGIMWTLCAATVLSLPLRQTGDPYADQVVEFKPGTPSNPQLADPGTRWVRPTSMRTA
jgi:hypothetical protein